MFIKFSLLAEMSLEHSIVLGFSVQRPTDHIVIAWREERT